MPSPNSIYGHILAQTTRFGNPHKPKFRIYPAGNRSSFSKAWWHSRASVGWAIALDCAVVSTTTRSRSRLASAPLLCATARLSPGSAPRARPRRAAASNASATSGRMAAGGRSSIRRRRTGNTGSPASVRTAPRPTADRLCMCFKISSPTPLAGLAMAAAHCPVCTRSKSTGRETSNRSHPPAAPAGWPRSMMSSTPAATGPSLVSWLCHLSPPRR